MTSASSELRVSLCLATHLKLHYLDFTTWTSLPRTDAHPVHPDLTSRPALQQLNAHSQVLSVHQVTSTDIEQQLAAGGSHEMAAYYDMLLSSWLQAACGTLHYNVNCSI